MAIKKTDISVAPELRHKKRAVGVFTQHEHAENAIRGFKDADFDMNNVSVLARHIDDVSGGREVNETHGNEASEGAGIGASTGTVLGGVTGFLIGVGLLAIPGVGPILAAGAEIGAVGSTLAGAGAGALAGGIVGALVGLGIPEEKAKVYEDRIKAGDYLLMVSGDDDTIRRAESIMKDHHVDDFEIFEPTTKEYVREDYAARGADINHRPNADVYPSGQDVPTTQGTHDREVTSARDLDNDRHPEVIVRDNRSKNAR